jgi:hypothetical protein
LNCGEKYRRLYIVPDAPPNIVGVKAKFGSAFHASLQYMYNEVLLCKEEQKAPDRVKMSEIAVTTFHMNFESGLNDVNVKPTKNDPDPAEAHAKGEEMIQEYIRTQLDRFDPAYVEHKIEFEIPGVTPFVSYVDLITTDGVIIDFKSGFKRLDEGAEHKSRQLTLYALGYYKKFGKMPKSVGLMSCAWGRDEGVKGGRGKPQFAWLESKRGPGHFRRLTETIRRTVDMLEVGIFLPPPEKSFLCNEEQCQFHSTCGVRP